MFGEEIGIDLGTSSILIYIKGQEVVLKEPSLIALDRKNRQIISIGEEAKNMIGKVPPNIEIIQPLKEGIVTDYNATETITKYLIQKVIEKSSIRRPKVYVSVPCNITEVEKRAVEDAMIYSGAREVFIIEQPLAAAIGSGIDINEPKGNMIVDIGAGTTNIAIISLGATVVSTSIKVAGDKFDEDIIKYIRQKHRILIGNKTAESIKINIGSAYRYEYERNYAMEIKGQNLVTCLPGVVSITPQEVNQAIQKSIDIILDKIHYILEKTPPELCSDICEKGITLVGGGALLSGIDKVISEKVGVSVNLSKEPITCVALGTGSYKHFSAKYSSHKYSKHKKKILKLNLKWR